MVTRFAPATHPTPVGSPDWFKLWVLTDRRQWKRETPQVPERLYSAVTDELPDPVLSPRTIAYDLTLDVAVISDGSVWRPLW